MKNYIVKQPGEIIGDFQIETITRYEKGEPVYSTHCEVCGVSGNPVTHDQFRKGTARCLSSMHGKAEIVPSGSASAQVTGRGNGWDEYYSAKLSAQATPEPPKVDLAEEQREKRRAAEQQRWTEVMHGKFRQYFNHALANHWLLEKLWSFAQFCSICDIDAFLAKQKSGYYDPAPGGNEC
jgi:hypothetical protein